jgi:capsular polysaccharide biosynthesis protein
MAMPADPVLYPEATLHLGSQLFVSSYKGVVEPGNRLLALDRDGRPIPHTYLGTLEAMGPLPAGDPIAIEEGFLFYATPWHANFQHFLTETFPKVVDYLAWIRDHDRIIPLLLPRFVANAFVEELLALLNLTEVTFVLEDPATYRVARLYSSSYVPNYDPPTEKMIAAFRLLRDMAQAAHPPRLPQAPRRLYLARDASANLARNNSNAGAGRVIRNESEIRDLLRTQGFEEVFLGGCDLPGKVQALAGAECLVSPIGANLMNLLFLSPPYPRRTIILHSTFLAFHAAYFRELLDGVFEGRVAVETVEGPAESETENRPYRMEPEGFRHLLRGWTGPWGSRMFPALPSGGRA